MENVTKKWTGDNYENNEKSQIELLKKERENVNK